MLDKLSVYASLPTGIVERGKSWDMKQKRDMQNLKSVGKRLVLTRRALDQGQAELARYLKISPQRLNNYERGLRPLDLDLAINMVKRWRLTLDWLYLGDESSLPKGLAKDIEAARRKGDEE